MNEKEFNRQILAALVEYANELIAAGRVSVAEPGRYTAYNIDRKKNDMGENLHIDMTDERERKQITVGNFTCTVAPCNVFGIICSFEKLAGVRGGEKTRFAFGDTRQDNIIKGRAMSVGSTGRLQIRTTSLRQVSEHIATDKNENRYFRAHPGGVWYWVANRNVSFDTITRRLTKKFLRASVEIMRQSDPGSRFLQILESLLAEWESYAPETGKPGSIITEEAEAGTTPAVNMSAETEKSEETVPEHTEGTSNEIVTETVGGKKRAQGARFAFSACGIQPGEKIVFTPEQIEVTVADDTHIEFCGELFTLSGFCRAFMPDGKRKPSNAYQGPKYFTYNGVTLVKLRAEKTACVEVETQDVRTEEKTAATPSDLAQERTEAHGLTTYRTEKNDGLKRTFARQTNTLVLRIFNGFSTEKQRKNTKYRKFSSRMVVHTLPLPPPYHRQQIK